MLPRLITKVVGWAVATFFDLARTGPRAPDGPVLLTANHPNALIDPLVLFRTAGRPTRPLAKAPLFEQAFVGTVLKGLGGLPVYRKQDDPSLMHLNDRTFDAAIEALHGGGAVQIYPEGRSHSEPALAPLRTGAARIALLAEARRDWTLGLSIQPVGLTYTRKHLFRGHAVAAYGEPFGVTGYRALFERDERAAARALTDEIQERLERLTLNFEHPEDAELVDVAERLYARHKRLARPRERQHPSERLPRLHAFAEGIRRLHATDPQRLERLRRKVRRYLRMLTLFGAREGDVPAQYRFGRVVRYGAVQLAMLLLVLPVAVLGAIVWAPPVLFSRHLAPRFRPKLDQLATYKLGTALLAFPIWYAAFVTGAWLSLGARWALAFALSTPVAGLAAVAWRDRQGVVREDARVFLRAGRRAESRDRLREQRVELVAEFDALAASWREEDRPDPRVDASGPASGNPVG